MTASVWSSFPKCSGAIKSPLQIRDLFALLFSERYDCRLLFITLTNGVACDFGVMGVRNGASINAAHQMRTEWNAHLIPVAPL